MPRENAGTEWIVLLEASDEAGHATIDPIRLGRLVTAWPEPAPATLYSPDRYAIQVPVRAVDQPSALSRVMALWKEAVHRAGLPHWELVRVEVVTPRELERELQAAESSAEESSGAPGGAGPTHDAVGDELLRRALHDPVTGLPDRELFIDEVRRAQMGASSGPSVAAALVVSIAAVLGETDRADQLPADDVLIEVAGRLCAAVRPPDTVARVGPADFGLLVQLPSAHDGDRLARRVVDALRAPVLRCGRPVALVPSVGVATTTSAAEGDDLFLMAETAMLGAKALGRDCPWERSGQPWRTTDWQSPYS